RWRIVRQLLAEGLLLAICGGVVGLILSIWCNNLLLHSLATLLNNVNFSFIVDFTPNFAVLAATFIFCLLATMLFSLGPALKATKADLVNDLKQQVGEPARIGRFSRFFAPRHISVMAQIGLSPMLLFAAGLFFRGQDFTQAECENKEGRAVGIIDELMAKKLFPNEDAIGQHVRYTVPPKDGSPNDIEIVGIVNTHRHDVQEDVASTGRLFVPFSQGYTGNVFFHVRLGSQDRQSVAGMISTTRSMLRNIDPDLP